MIGSIEAGNYKSTRPKNSRHFPHTYRQDYLCWCNRRYAPIRIIDNVEKDCCILEEKSTWAILEAFCKFYLEREKRVFNTQTVEWTVLSIFRKITIYWSKITLPKMKKECVSAWMYTNTSLQNACNFIFTASEQEIY